MTETKLVLLEADDLMHQNTGEPNFNESAYYNFYDRAQRAGGFVRLGNRPNEGYAEMTVCLYLPDGSAGFMFNRPRITDNQAHNAGGLSFEVLKPFKQHRIAYRGGVCSLKNPLDLAEPSQAFKNNPHVACELELDFAAIAPGWGGEMRQNTARGWESVKAGGDPSQQFLRGHLEQHGRLSGTLKLAAPAGLELRIDGLGLRDHSWGPRYWQAPRYYRWLTMNFDGTLGAVASLTVNRDGREHPGGFIARTGHPNLNFTEVRVETEFTGDLKLHNRIKVACRTDDGGEPVVITGKVLAMVPLRNRRAGVVTRIAEGMTEWNWNGIVGYGLAEYLDHLE
jgi:hypothetical protein